MSKGLKHTNGEWITGDHYNTIECDKQQICAMFTSKPIDEKIANAKLIASAPELLDALIKTKDTIEETSKCPFLPDWIKVLLHTRLCEIETAINKATS